MKKPLARFVTYASAGVDEHREQFVFQRVMRRWLQDTPLGSPYASEVESVEGLEAGHFATVLRFKTGTSIALSTDGVGTKILVARMARRYDTVGIDCVANNVNDLICIGADPLALLDYIAIDRIDEEVLGQIARGLSEGANLAGVTIPGGEIAQVKDLLAENGSGEPMFDLVGTALGMLPPGREMTDGSSVAPGDVVVGLPSSGLHSNGYSLARKVLFDHAGLALDDPVPGVGRSLADELLEPTRIYVPAVRRLWEHDVPLHGLVNISGGGLLNLGRLPADVTYVLDDLPTPPPIFRLIQELGGVQTPHMYETFNMGIGICLLIPETDVVRAIEVLEGEDDGEAPVVIGVVTDEPGRLVRIPSVQLVGAGDEFSPAA